MMKVRDVNRITQGLIMEKSVYYPPLRERLVRFFQSASKEIIIVSPWLKMGAIDLLLENIDQGVSLRLITRARLEDFLSGSSDLDAFEALLNRDADIFLLDNLHAKVFIKDKTEAIIGSANLTDAGLQENLEIGVSLKGRAVAGLVSQIEGWRSQARRVDKAWMQDAKRGVEGSRFKHAMDFRPVYNSISKKGNGLRGPKIGLKKYSGHRDPTIELKEDHGFSGLKDWRADVRSCKLIKNDPARGNLVVTFFEKSMGLMTEAMRESTWFGLHDTRISITVGNIWLAALSYKDKGLQLLVSLDYEGPWASEAAKSTLKHTPLKWVKAPLDKCENFIGSDDLWNHYLIALEQIWDSPISRNNIKRNHKRKRLVSSLYG